MIETVKINGLSQLATNLRELPKNIGRNVLRGAVAAGSAEIRNEAKLRAPVYTGPIAQGHPPPGTLQRAIFIKREKGSAEASATRVIYSVFVRQAKNYSVGQKNIKAYGKLDAYYWRFVEFGTSKMAARPFMRPAFEAKKYEAIEAIKIYLGERIPTEANKLKL